MKQAIVDKMPSVSSAALVSSLHLMKQGPDVVKRWVNEVTETVNSDNVMVQVRIYFKTLEINNFHFIIKIFKVSRFGPALSNKKERQVGNNKISFEILQVIAAVTVCLLFSGKISLLFSKNLKKRAIALYCILYFFRFELLLDN